jgi:maleylacetoacetate isomerase
MKVYVNNVSNAPLRIRIALALKNLHAEEIFIDLDAGENHRAAYRALNPQAMLPTLVDGEAVITQSLAIIEYLEEKYPHPPLLPSDPQERARVRSLALLLACDGQPLLNLRVRRYLADPLGLAPEKRAWWFRHWMSLNLSEYEAMIAGHPATGLFSHGDHPTLADVCLFPQVLMAQRFDVPLARYPTINRVVAACRSIPAFNAVASRAVPEAV